VAVALLFDFVNGMNDAANSIATVVSTRVLTPLQAVAWAAFFNFVAAFFFDTKVADTIAKIVDNDVVTVPMVLAALVGGISWAHLCTVAGLPISVSHSLIGGVLGACFAKEGLGPGMAAVHEPAILKAGIFIVASPLAGMAGGYLLMLAVLWTFRGSDRRSVDRWFRWGQLASSAAFSLSHGLSDAQKIMGIIVMVLVAGGRLAAGSEVPYWVILSAHASIGLGTLIGGWRVIHTMGTRLTKLKPHGGFCAETAGAAVCIGTAMAGIPVSTTHTVVGSILGVGATQRVGAVRWEVAGKIVGAWVLTIPCAAMAGALAWWIVDRSGLAALAAG
jgi:PiT family inorganic phosphate transporter